MPPELAKQAVQSMMDRHYRETLDTPIPALEGKTPRQAAKTKKGRAMVIDWLKRLENMEARRAISEGGEPYDTRWMWRELGIEPQG